MLATGGRWIPERPILLRNRAGATNCRGSCPQRAGSGLPCRPSPVKCRIGASADDVVGPLAVVCNAHGRQVVDGIRLGEVGSIYRVQDG
jgi:hypothetical protein